MLPSALSVQSSTNPSLGEVLWLTSQHQGLPVQTLRTSLGPKQPDTPEPQVYSKGKSEYWNRPRMTLARGNPAWRKGDARRAVA